MATAAIVLAIVSVSATTAAVIAAGVNIAIAFTAAYLMAKKYKSGLTGAVAASDYSQMVKEDTVPQRVVYGKRQLSMVLSFVEEESGDQEEGELLYLAGMVCNHEVHSISNFLLDDTLASDIEFHPVFEEECHYEQIGDGDGGTENGDLICEDVYVGEEGAAQYAHVNGTGAIPDWLINETQNFTSEMKGEGAYWIALKLKFDTDYFTTIPTPKVTVQGRNKIKDFRDGTFKYTANAALVIADFYINYMNIDESRLIMSGSGSFIDAANLCDEVMADGGKRYEINGMFTLDQKPSDILNEMLKSCGGTLVRQAGLIGLLPAAYYGPSSFTIDESMATGISIQPEQSTADAVNVMSGTYVSELDEWAEQDFTAITDDYAISRDGQEITEDITYSYVTNDFQAQRLASIELRRRTAANYVELTLSPLGAYCRIGRVVELDLPQVNISGTFRVTGQTENEDQTYTINLQKDELSIYDDAVGEQYVPAPTLSTGTNLTPSPSGLQFSSVNNVGNEIQGALTWYVSSASIDHFDVEVENSSGEIVQSGVTSAFNYNLTALEIGNYTARVRSVNNRGATSTYATTTFSVGKPAIPSSVEVNKSNWNVELIPNITGGVPQGTLFEYWYLADDESHITGQPTYNSGSQGLSALVATASSLNKGSLFPDRWQHFWIRSVNPYGKSDFVYIQAWTTKEQDLVTTVVERLVAIEIESANWDDDAGTGYKIFSPASDPYTMPDGTVLENPDGLAVFNNAVVKGNIQADSGTLNNVIIEEDCEVKGTIYAGQISGDVATVRTQYTSGGVLANSESMQVVNVTMTSVGYDRTFIFGSILYQGPAYVRMYKDGVQVYEFRARFAGDTASPQFAVDLPKNVTSTFTVTIQRDSSSFGDLTILEQTIINYIFLDA